MGSFRLFIMLVCLTAAGLAIVYLRIASVRTAYHVHQLHAQQWEKRREIVRQRAQIARLSDPQVVRQWATKSAGLVAPRLPSPSGQPEPVNEWEREEPAARPDREDDAE